MDSASVRASFAVPVWVLPLPGFDGLPFPLLVVVVVAVVAVVVVFVVVMLWVLDGCLWVSEEELVAEEVVLVACE